MDKLQKYRFVCTLSFGDIYGQIIVWLIVIFLSLASSLALWTADRHIYALTTVGLILVVTLPFLLFTFVTTLVNHIEIAPMTATETTQTYGGSMSNQKPAQVVS